MSREPGHKPHAHGDLRCDCGNLLARLLAGEIEMKCRRCKRVVTVRLAGDPGGGIPILEVCGCGAEDSRG